MATSILAVNTTEATSGTVTLADGEQATFFLVLGDPALRPDNGSFPIVYLQVQRADSTYINVASLSGGNNAFVLSAAGTYRFFRPASRFACGVDRG